MGFSGTISNRGAPGPGRSDDGFPKTILAMGRELVKEVLTTSFKGSITQYRSSQRTAWKGSRGSMIDIVHT